MISILGCSGKKETDESHRTLSDRERDSILAESDLPGSSVVGRAISVADSVAARSERIESQVKKIDNN